MSTRVQKATGMFLESIDKQRKRQMQWYWKTQCFSKAIREKSQRYYVEKQTCLGVEEHIQNCARRKKKCGPAWLLAGMWQLKGIRSKTHFGGAIYIEVKRTLYTRYGITYKVEIRCVEEKTNKMLLNGLLHLESAQHVTGTSMFIMMSSRLHVCYCRIWCIIPSFLVVGGQVQGGRDKGSCSKSSFPHSWRIACCPAPDLRKPSTIALHTICDKNTTIISSSWWWA
jgi:hypothetical protein